MTETLYIDEDGSELIVTDSGDRLALRVTDVVDGSQAAAYMPRRVIDAIRTALAAGDGYDIVALPKDAVLADVSKLLEQCDREDTNPDPLRRFLTTDEIRMILRQPVPCRAALDVRSGGVPPRCSRNVHPADSPHVDRERGLEWTDYDDGNFDVRGWNGTDYDAPKEERVTTVDRIVSALDKLIGDRVGLTENECQQLLVSNNVIIPATTDDWVVVMRERAVRAVERGVPARDFAKGAEPRFLMRVAPELLADALDICKIPSDYTPTQVRERFRASGLKADELTDAQIAEALAARGGES